MPIAVWFLVRPAQVPEETRLAFCRFWRAIVLRDDKELFDSSAALGVTMATAFAAMFLQQPYYSSGVGLKLRMTKEDIELMQFVAREQVR
jgi:hypothetical protein